MKNTKPDTICKKCAYRNPTTYHRCFKNILVIRYGVETNISGRGFLSKDGLSCKYFLYDKNE